MHLGGWKTPSVVMRYAHVNASHMGATINRMWGISGEQPVGPNDIVLINQAK
jgi:hypothetical protein